jgi:hypothetical protein
MLKSTIAQYVVIVNRKNTLKNKKIDQKNYANSLPAREEKIGELQKE